MGRAVLSTTVRWVNLYVEFLKECKKLVFRAMENTLLVEGWEVGWGGGGGGKGITG